MNSACVFTSTSVNNCIFSLNLYFFVIVIVIVLVIVFFPCIVVFVFFPCDLSYTV